MPIIEKPKSICVLRLSAIGDVCHAVAMVQAIQRQHPSAKITWIIGKVEASLVAGLPNVEFVIFDKSLGWRGFVILWHQLKGRQFDVLLHMQVALRASICSLGVRAKHRIGFDKQRAKEGQWLFCNRQISAQNEPHVLDGFMAFAKVLGVDNTSAQWNIPLSTLDKDFAEAIIPDGINTLVICPAASKAERNWLPERYAAVVDFASNHGLSVILCGGPSKLEQELAKEIQAHAKTEPQNLTGQTSLKQLLALLGRAKVVLAPDTGPAHMAVTQDTPTIGLYAHSNPGRTGPYLYQDLVVSVYQQHIQSQKSIPMKQIPWGTRAKGSTLMHDIEVQPVIDRLSSVLAG